MLIPRLSYACYMPCQSQEHLLKSTVVKVLRNSLHPLLFLVQIFFPSTLLSNVSTVPDGVRPSFISIWMIILFILIVRFLVWRLEGKSL